METPQKSDAKLEKRQLSVQIADLLAAEITAMDAGAKLPTINGLAARFGVSVLTVREAISALTQRGLVERVRGRAMRVADRRSSQHVGVLIELDIAHPSTPYAFRRMCQVAVQQLREQGFAARLYAGHVVPYEPPLEAGSSCPEFLEAVRTGQLCGLVTVCSPPQPLWMEPLAAQGVPVVGLGSPYAYSVELDYPAMIARGARHLVAAGCQRIAFMEWHTGWGKPSAGEPLRRPFTDILRAAGLPVRPEWMRHDLHPSRPGSGWEGLRDIWNALPEKPDGLLVCDDNLMRDAVIAILSLGIRVPEDLLVVSHANRGSGIAYPFPVTEITADPDRMALAQVETLVSLMRGETPACAKACIPFEPGSDIGGDGGEDDATTAAAAKTSTRRRPHRAIFPHSPATTRRGLRPGRHPNPRALEDPP